MLQNARWEKFAQLVAAGVAYADAYRKAGYAAKCPTLGSRLAKTAEVMARIAEIRAEAAKTAALSKEQAIEKLVAIITTPIGEVDEKHWLAQEAHYTETGRRIKMPGKIEALRVLGQWCGWEKGTEADRAAAAAAGSIAAAMAEIRKRKGSRL